MCAPEQAPGIPARPPRMVSGAARRQLRPQYSLFNSGSASSWFSLMRVT